MATIVNKGCLTELKGSGASLHLKSYLILTLTFRLNKRTQYIPLPENCWANPNTPAFIKMWSDLCFIRFFPKVSPAMNTH